MRRSDQAEFSPGLLTRKDNLLTKYYLELRRQLLLRCDQKRLSQDVRLIQRNSDYQRKFAHNSEALVYIEDRPIFDQFIPGPRIFDMPRTPCTIMGCLRESCDDFHNSPNGNILYDGWCHCAQINLLSIWYVVNRYTGRRAWVGSHCVEHFNMDIQRAYYEFERSDIERGRIFCLRIRQALRRPESYTDAAISRLIDISKSPLTEAQCYREYGDEMAELCGLPRPEELGDFIIPDGEQGSLSYSEEAKNGSEEEEYLSISESEIRDLQPTKRRRLRRVGLSEDSFVVPDEEDELELCSTLDTPDIDPEPTPADIDPEPTPADRIRICFGVLHVHMPSDTKSRSYMKGAKSRARIEIAGYRSTHPDLIAAYFQ